MAECNVQQLYKTEETFCVNYRPWCSACDRGAQRRRSISETSEPCRRKNKELKILSKRCNRSREYENMDLEYDCKGQYQEKDPTRYEQFTRIRSNLCELPTSYISNNCQLSNNVTNPKISNELSSFDSSKTIHAYENPVIKFAKLNEQIPNDLAVDDMQGKLRTPKKESKCSMRPLEHEHFQSKSDQLNNFTMTRVRQENPISPEFCSLSELKLRNISGLKPFCFETKTYFDRREDSLNLAEKHARELNRLREQLMSLKDSKRPANEAPCLKENTRERPRKSGEDNKAKNKVSLKTKIKPNSGKLKAKVKPKVPVTANFNLAESDECGSDSENETNLDEVDNVSERSTTDESSKDILEPVLYTEQADSGSPDSLYWMLRPSLFPNVPPYIRFNPHDHHTGEVKYGQARKYLKWKLSTITPILVRKTLVNSGFLLVRKSSAWLGTWGKHMKSPLFKSLRETQKLNHFPGTFQLGRKDRLWRNFQKMILKFGVREFGFLPHTYILPQEAKLLKQCWEYKISNAGTSDMWIIKPPASARGVGIKVINKLSQIPKKNNLIVQKYISNPYLINGSKFDLRLYVLVTSFHPLVIYLYPEGLARFASAKYSSDAKDLKDRYMHLTNYSINKLSSQYTANEDFNSCEGHKWTITKLLEVLETQNVDTKALWKTLQQLVIKTLIACESPIVQLCEENMLSRYNCYELFGVDVLLDEKMKPWLLEVNISPSLHSASPLDAHVKGPIVQTIFNMAQFHLPPRMKLHQDVEGPDVLDSRFYCMSLNRREQRKHSHYEQLETRNEYLDSILKNLTSDDVRLLAKHEDELSVKGKFERIFPNQQSYKYLQFMIPRYYNRLFDAWEYKYGHRREKGISLLQELCDRKMHLKVPATSKNSLNTTHSDTNHPEPPKPDIIVPVQLPVERTLTQEIMQNQII